MYNSLSPARMSSSRRSAFLSIVGYREGVGMNPTESIDEEETRKAGVVDIPSLDVHVLLYLFIILLSDRSIELGEKVERNVRTY